MIFRPAQTLTRSLSESKLAGGSMLIRLRNGTIGLLGLVAAVGLGLIAFVSQQGWPGVSSGPLPQRPPTPFVQHETIALPLSVPGPHHRSLAVARRQAPSSAAAQAPTSPPAPSSSPGPELAGAEEAPSSGVGHHPPATNDTPDTHPGPTPQPAPTPSPSPPVVASPPTTVAAAPPATSPPPAEEPSGGPVVAEVPQESPNYDGHRDHSPWWSSSWGHSHYGDPQYGGSQYGGAPNDESQSGEDHSSDDGYGGEDPDGDHHCRHEGSDWFGH